MALQLRGRPRFPDFEASVGKHVRLSLRNAEGARITAAQYAGSALDSHGEDVTFTVIGGAQPLVMHFEFPSGKHGKGELVEIDDSGQVQVVRNVTGDATTISMRIHGI